jgi:multiple sugar transport system ATP-binding protein
LANLQVRRVGKQFGAVRVLSDIDIDIADGEFLTLVGPSGCGKSTLLRLIAGLEDISEGEILIGGRRVNGVPPKDRDIAMVFQNYALYPHMRVAENMGFALEMRNEPRARIEDRVRAAAATLGLEKLLDRYPRQLSGGQRQRVAMGRAIVRNPQVFLFDEPLSNLDAKLRVAMRAEIKDLQQRLRTTTVYVTHDQIEAMTMADRIVVMRSGVVEQMGSPIDLYDNPVNTFVATFIGSPAMNLIEGELTDGDAFKTRNGQSISVTGRSKSHPEKPRAAFLGVRPEHIDLSETGLAGTVVVVEPTGSETHIAAKVEGSNVVIVLRDRIKLTPGEPIRLRPQTDKVYLFDSASGQLI